MTYLNFVPKPDFKDAILNQFLPLLKISEKIELAEKLLKANKNIDIENTELRKFYDDIMDILG